MEYSNLLWPNDQSPTWVFALKLESNSYRHLLNILGMNTSKMVKIFVKNEKVQPVTLNHLLNHIDRCREKIQTGSKIRTLALVIYGMVIFPSGSGFINDKVIIFCDQVFRGAMNPVSAILAETFRSLNFCHQAKKCHLGVVLSY